VVEKQLKGFMLFVRQQGVVGLAVGLVLGTAIKSVVDSLVASILNPLIGLLTGGVNLNDKFFCLSKSGTECVNKLAYGSFISTVISFLTIAAVVYFGVKGLKLDKLDISKDMEKGVKKGTAGAGASSGKVTKK
jgi:large conductance mechanosensitive channel